MQLPYNALIQLLGNQPAMACPIFFAHPAFSTTPPSLFFVLFLTIPQLSLSGCQSCHRYTEWRATDIVQTNAVTEIDGFWVTAMLTKLVLSAEATPEMGYLGTLAVDRDRVSCFVTRDRDP